MRQLPKAAKVIVTVYLSVMTAMTATGQDVTQPVSPRLDMVTVDPATGFAVIRWISSPSADVGSYVVYIFSGSVATAIDTVRSPYITEYTHTASAARYRSVTYVVAAVDSSLNISPLSNSLSTVWLSATEDPCLGKVIVTWTPYENQYHPATGYRLNIATGAGATLPPVDLSASENSYGLSGYEPETEYCFHVTAIDGSSQQASSNSACLNTGSEVPPLFVRLDAIAAENQGLTIYGSYDAGSTMTVYRLYRYDGAAGSWIESGSSTGTAGIVSFDLPGADTTIINLYRVSAVNSCGVASTTSEPARSMVPVVSLTDNRIELRWNSPSSGGSELYSVWRDTGGDSVEVASSLSDTIWSEDISAFASEITGAGVVYRITASSPSAPPGAPEHRSPAVFIETPEKIYMPNAFTPGIPGENSVFKPEFAFLPVSYEFRVWTRSGVLLFRTTDHEEGWDGRYNGVMMQPGVYLWSLRITAPSGQTESRNGTVTILP